MAHLLENDKIRIEFDEATGGITKFCCKETGWELIRQPKLAMGIQLRVPAPGHRWNLAESGRQKLASFAAVPEEGTAALRWEGLDFDQTGPLPIDVEMRVDLTPGGASFTVTVDNRSQYMVEEVWAPNLGGFREPAGEQPVTALGMHFQGGFTKVRLGDGFPLNDYWGIDFPTVIKTFPSPDVTSPFMLLQKEGGGLYWGVHDPQPEIASFVYSFRPGYLDSKRHRLPPGDELSGNPAGFCVSLVRVPCIQPGQRRTLAPVELKPYKGDWRRGIKAYREWEKTWYRPVPAPKWTEETDCWMTLQMNSSEGRCKYSYRDLPAIMKEAKQYGVQALQLIGWATGGQDGNEPFQDTDPLLGTREELMDAIRQIEEMGIRVLLMCKFKWADQSAPEFADKMAAHTLKDMRGHPVPFGGYAYDTLFQRFGGGSIHNGYGLCHSSADYRRAALEEFRKILELKPSGILYDELANPMLCCFDTSHGHAYGESIHKGSLLLAKEFYSLARETAGEFAFAGEGPSDVLSQYYSTNYIRSWDDGNGPHCPAGKYLHPEMRFASCLVGWDDRELANQCLVYGYILNYEPYNFKGRMSDIPLTAQYGMKIRKLRRRLWEYLWKGKFLHTDTAQVRPVGETGEYIYSVFEAENGKRAIAVANQEAERTLTLRVTADSGCTEFLLYTPEGDEAKASGSIVEIPARCACVLVEQ
ncbi:MAG TPA: hypothetical protein IAB51_10810 [Candidatus Merdivicinus excrementipullorum]|uniref:DUF6259 domain-containing protein n=1 Tax=Candidatus Merdivicinus excrementipullorum TaxID=2840867 RepID=A0A9D1FNV7_9FIRM|nr:hypothetical protein [Candidatus Merdivicinus excrementipullorum]